MLVGFDKWWQEDGKMIDPDTEDVPWFDKRKALAELAFEAGIKCGMARAANYVASDSVMPDRVEFANGRTVQIVDNPAPGVHLGVFLEVGMKAEVICSCGKPVSQCSRLHDDHCR